MSQLNQALAPIVSAALCCGLTVPVAAGESPGATPVPRREESAALLEEVVVTSSRIARSGFAAPTPTTVLDAEQLERRGSTNFAQILNEIPAFKNSYGGASPGVRLIAGVNFADLRGLSPVRTLVLVDGRRYVPEVASTNPETSYQVDLNQIPTLMIDRVEVVTGGASAQWGSDALAGVVNVILKKRMTGFTTMAQYGVADAGDNREVMYGLAGGMAMGQRAHLDVGFEYVDNDGVRPPSSRDWGRKEVFNLATGAAPATGLAKNVIAADIRYNNMTPGGVIVSTAGGAPASLIGLQFGVGVCQPLSLAARLRGQARRQPRRLLCSPSAEAFPASAPIPEFR